ncbi:MAG TPA: hypothetical protein VK654_04850, partial [Nitrospirota bacterium]|nr:hypothetical protein [Nitrospirota bacterium]
QPFFTEGTFKKVMRPAGGDELPLYRDVSLPITEKANEELIKLPSFPGPDNGILNQYAKSFEKVIEHAEEIGGVTS